VSARLLGFPVVPALAISIQLARLFAGQRLAGAQPREARFADLPIECRDAIGHQGVEGVELLVEQTFGGRQQAPLVLGGRRERCLANRVAVEITP